MGDSENRKDALEPVQDEEGMAELVSLEGKMRAGFREVALALSEICDRKLFQAAGYGNFVDYCKERVNYQKSRAYQLASAGRVLPMLKPETQDMVTSSILFQPIDGMKAESQARVLELSAKVATSQGVPLSPKVVADVAEANFNWLPRAKYQAQQRQEKGDDPDSESAKRKESLFLGLEAIEGIGLGGYDAVQEFGSPFEWPGAVEVRQFLNDAFDADEG